MAFTPADLRMVDDHIALGERHVVASGNWWASSAASDSRTEDGLTGFSTRGTCLIAESISLAMHELTSNAVKHGALINSGGRIEIKWKVNGDGSGLHFKWSEAHANGKVPKATRHGFGMELLTRILPYDLNPHTKVEFVPDGLRFSMDLPRENLVHE